MQNCPPRRSSPGLFVRSPRSYGSRPAWCTVVAPLPAFSWRRTEDRAESPGAEPCHHPEAAPGGGSPEPPTRGRAEKRTPGTAAGTDPKAGTWRNLRHRRSRRVLDNPSGRDIAPAVTLLVLPPSVPPDPERELGASAPPRLGRRRGTRRPPDTRRRLLGRPGRREQSPRSGYHRAVGMRSAHYGAVRRGGPNSKGENDEEVLRRFGCCRWSGPWHLAGCVRGQATCQDLRCRAECGRRGAALRSGHECGTRGGGLPRRRRGHGDSRVQAGGQQPARRHRRRPHPRRTFGCGGTDRAGAAANTWGRERRDRPRNVQQRWRSWRRSRRTRSCITSTSTPFQWEWGVRRG